MRSVMRTALILSSFFLAISTGSSDGLEFSNKRRRDNEEPFVCPFSIERLFYNIDIFIEGIGEECEIEDLMDIGEILQKVVEEVEEEIPDRDQYERMDTFVCPKPLEEDILRRNLRASHDTAVIASRLLRKRRIRRKRYRYAGSGKCRRCRKANSDRRHLQAVSAQEACTRSDMATYAASIASTATRSASVSFSGLKNNVLTYCDYVSRGQEAVMMSKIWTMEGQEASKIAQQEAKRARQQCQLARQAVSDMERLQYARSAGTASNDALNAAENARSRFHLVRKQQLQWGDVCREEPANNTGGSISMKDVCDEAELAQFGADMTASVALQAEKLYTNLTDRAMQCSDLESQEPFLTAVKAVATRARSAQNRAGRSAREARTQCQLAAEATSGNELTQYWTRAQEITDGVIEQFETGENSYFELEQLVSTTRTRCYIPPSPSKDVSVEQVCNAAKKASYGAEMAARLLRKVNAAFVDIRQVALECDTLESGQTAVERARIFAGQGRKMQREARTAARTANAQCQQAAASNANGEIRQYLQAAGTAATAALRAAETAKSRYILLIGENDRTDICSQPPVEADSNAAGNDVDFVCLMADRARFGADMAVAAARSAIAAFRVSNERALEACQDLRQGQDLVTKAKRTLTTIQLARRLALNGARRAKAECRRARDPSSTVMLQSLGENAKRYANDAIVAAQRTKKSYRRLQDGLDSTSICGDDPARDTGRGKVVEPPPPAPRAGAGPTAPTYYSGGTQDHEESLRTWLVKLANMLYVKIPPPIMEAYSASTAAEGSCRLEGFKINIRIDAFEELGDSAYWIANESDCSNVQ